MLNTHKKILPLVDNVKIDRFNIKYSFKCKEKNQTVTSTVPFEPFDGKIELTLLDKILHPIESHNRINHTPIIIYGNECNKSIALKAFKQVSKYFSWNSQKDKYIYSWGQ